MAVTLIALVLVVVFPLAWFASEFYNNRSARITLGVLAIAMSFLVAFVVGSLEQIRSNAYFGDTSKRLIETTVVELEAGNTEQVLARLKDLQVKYRPTYESRADYENLVEQYAAHFADENAPR